MRNFGYTEEGRVGSLLDVQIWKRIFRYCRAYLPWLALAVVLSLLVTGATLGLPRLMQLGIDNFISRPELGIGRQLSGIGWVAAGYGILVGMIFLCGFCQVVVLEWVGQMIMHRLRQELFVHMLTLDVGFFHQQPTGRLVTRLTNDIQNMHEMFTSVMVTLFNDLLKLSGIMILLYLMNVRLALVMTLFLPASIGVTLFFSRMARERFRAIRSQLAHLNSFLQEAVSNMATVQLFGREKKLQAEYRALTGEYLQRTFAQIRLFGTFLPLTEFMGTTAVALILWYGGKEVIARSLTLGELVAFLFYMRLFFQPMRELSQKYSIVQSAMASAERIFQLMDTRTTMQTVEPPHIPVSVTGGVRFDRVSFGYDREALILEDFSLDIPAGKITALIGTTGAGKSTLAGMLVRFYDPLEGRILFDGVDIRRYPLETLRKSVGIIMQDVFILPDTVRENIVAGSTVSSEGLLDLIEQTGLTQLIERLPEGLETVIGEGGVELSAGEKQLLSFVRVLARNPALLIFDEATAAIDTESENILEQAVNKGFHDRTVLVIAHRLSTVRRADLILVMEEGRIVEQGSHTDLMEKNGVYKKLVEIDLMSPGNQPDNFQKNTRLKSRGQGK